MSCFFKGKVAKLGGLYARAYVYGERRNVESTAW